MKFVVAPLGFVANGAGELAAAAVFMWRPSLCGFVHQPLDPNALFLFKAWALSIAGFATMTISAASDAEHAPERTEAITCGAILYHGTVAVCYVKHFRDGVLLHDWLGGAALHCLGLAFFSYHLWAHVYAARREAWIEAGTSKRGRRGTSRKRGVVPRSARDWASRINHHSRHSRSPDQGRRSDRDAHWAHPSAFARLPGGCRGRRRTPP